MSGMLEKLNKKKTKIIDIGFPTDMRQIVHVSKNPKTGKLEGLPTDWSKVLDTQVTPAELNEKPDASIRAVVHTIKRKAPDIPSKPLHTAKAITEENKEIEKTLDSKNADQSQDSNLKIGQSSEEEVNKVGKKSQSQTIKSVEPKENSDAAICSAGFKDEASIEETKEMEQKLDHENSPPETLGPM